MVVDNRLSFINFFSVQNIVITSNLNNTQCLIDYFNYEKISITCIKTISQLKVNEKTLCIFKSRKSLKSILLDEYVIVPSINNPKWVIKNDISIIMNHGHIIKPTALLSKIVWSTAKIFAKFNLFTLIFPFRLLVVKDNLHEYFNNSKLQGIKPEIIYTGAIGKYQKFTIQLRVGQDLYFYKASNTNEGKARVLNEKKALQELNELNVRNFIIPLFIEEITNEDFYGIVQKSIIDSKDKLLLDLHENDFKFFIELRDIKNTRMIRVADYFNEINFYPNLLIGHRNFYETIKNKFIFLSASHGDYIPWNRFIHTTKIKIIDWEVYKDRPLFYDLICFILHKMILIQHENTSKTLNKCILEIKRVDNCIQENDLKLYLFSAILELLTHYSLNENDLDNYFISRLAKLLTEMEYLLNTNYLSTKIYNESNFSK